MSKQREKNTANMYIRFLALFAACWHFTACAANTTLAANLPLWSVAQENKRSSFALTSVEDGILEKVKALSRSQHGEEVFAVQNYLRRVRNGFYLEMGALDGLLFSNTLGLQDVMGWHGLLIEADPANHHDLKRNRKDAICLHAAVCNSHQTVHWASGSVGAVRGIWEFMNPAFRSGWHSRVALSPVSCVPLRDLVRLFRIAHIDFFSLDVEGAELAVLQTVDFGALSFGVLVIEADGDNMDKDQGVRDLLASHGYERVMPSPQPPGYKRPPNDWFVNTRMRADYTS